MPCHHFLRLHCILFPTTTNIAKTLIFRQQKMEKAFFSLIHHHVTSLLPPSLFIHTIIHHLRSVTEFYWSVIYRFISDQLIFGNSCRQIDSLSMENSVPSLTHDRNPWKGGFLTSLSFICEVELKFSVKEPLYLSTGFAFIYMEDERDAKDAIRGLDRIDFGRKRRRLRVEWTKEERGERRPSNPKRSSGNSRPSKTLFVINFDPYSTRSRDLERHFDPYGKIENVRIRKNFAFIQFETQEDATRALEATDSSKLLDRVISVEYSIKNDDDRRGGFSPNRNRDRSPGRVRERSLSPYRRERGSPDYGRGRSPSPCYRRERASPDYGRRASPSPHRRERSKEKGSPESGRASSIRERERGSPKDYRGDQSPDSKHGLRDSSPKPNGVDSPAEERYRSRSPPERERSRS